MDTLASIEKKTSKFEVTGSKLSGQVTTEISMIDGKMADLLQGDSGAFCHYCTATRESANNIKGIEEGFEIEKSIATCKATWEALDAGEISYHDSARAGQVYMNPSTAETCASMASPTKSYEA